MGRLEQLENFMQVVESGSISAAAQHLRVAKSAVSRQLAELESRLETQLLLRTTRRMSLTAAGSRVYEQARALRAQFDKLETGLEESNSAPRGRIRLSAPMSFGLSHLGAALNQFLALNPGIELYVDFDDRRVDMVAEGYDLVVRIGQLQDSSLVARKLTTTRGIVCASPGYLARHGTPATPEELERHQCLRYGLSRIAGWPYTDPEGLTGTVAFQPRVESTSGNYLRECMLAGLGIGMLPSFIVHEALRDGRLVALLSAYRWISVDIHVMFARRTYQPQRIRALLDHLVESFAEPVPPWEQELPGPVFPAASMRAKRRSKRAG